MNPQTTTQHTYAPLDTYSALLLTKIQDREAGDLLCYANPQRAELILRAVNSHAQIVAALSIIADRLMVYAKEADVSARTFPNAPGNGDFRRLARDLSEAETQARRALSLAKGEA